MCGKLFTSKEGWQEHAHKERHKHFAKTLVALKQREKKAEEKKGKKNPALIAARKEAL
jgi:hypothetical protein